MINIGDCREVMRTFEANSFDSIVTDPPYEFGFMGKKWDSSGVAFDPATWREALRVVKPGAYMLAFGGTRTHHRLMCAIEDAGWEIRDVLMWIYGSGFPKSHNLGGCTCGTETEAHAEICRLNTVGWSDWQGWGTALKPAWEPIILARKPLDGTVAANVLANGTGALNIDDCRVPGSKPDTTRGAGGQNGRYGAIGAQGRIKDDGLGRWPANVLHDGSDEVLAAFPQARSAGYVTPAEGRNLSQARGVCYGEYGPRVGTGYNDAGSAARFFYCAKASRKDRNDGCDALPRRTSGMVSNTSGQHITRRDGGAPAPAANHHPTVKPTDLMRWCCRLITPPQGKILDLFAGSGSTGRGAVAEGFQFEGIELEADYTEIAEARIRAVKLMLPLEGAACGTEDTDLFRI